MGGPTLTSYCIIWKTIIHLGVEDLDHQIAYIENHEGMWTIGFTAYPSFDLMVYIFGIFQSKISYDGIYELIFNYGLSNKVTIKNFNDNPNDKLMEALTLIEKNIKA